MIRGTTMFFCDKCGKIFSDLDIEFMATTLSVPRKCPKCGSFHTMPLGLLSMLKKPLYRKIWENMDKTNRND